MEKQSIKITVAERTYPLKINPADEEKIRIAVSKIRQVVDNYKNTFKDRDIQDALSMSLLHFAVKVVELEQNRDLDVLVEDLINLDKQLNEYITVNQ